MSKSNFIDSDSNQLHVDYISGAMTTLARVHRETHEGNLFTGYHIYTAVANDAVVYLVVNTPAVGYVHVAFHADVGGESNSVLYETATATTGTPLVPYNRKRSQVSPDVTTITLEHTPGAPSAGTQMFPEILPGGTGPLSSGGESSFPEKILAQSTKYILAVTNKSGGAKDMGLGCTFYLESKN